MAPFYDLLSVATYDTPAFNKKAWPTKTQLAWPILRAHHFSDIHRTLLLEAGESLNLAKGTAERLLENLRSRVVQEAEGVYVEVETENAQISHARPALSATLAGDLRCLRTILHTIIKETAQQLS